MHVDITKEHIKNGIRRNITRCPIALALKGKTEDDIYVCVTFGLNRSRKEMIYLPPTAMRFISSFDRGDAVLPISFETIVFDGETDSRYLALEKELR